jgi:hypothetical protein
VVTNSSGVDVSTGVTLGNPEGTVTINGVEMIEVDEYGLTVHEYKNGTIIYPIGTRMIYIDPSTGKAFLDFDGTVRKYVPIPQSWLPGGFVPTPAPTLQEYTQILADNLAAKEATLAIAQAEGLDPTGQTAAALAVDEAFYSSLITNEVTPLTPTFDAAYIAAQTDPALIQARRNSLSTFEFNAIYGPGGFYPLTAAQIPPITTGLFITVNGVKTEVSVNDYENQRVADYRDLTPAEYDAIYNPAPAPPAPAPVYEEDTAGNVVVPPEVTITVDPTASGSWDPNLGVAVQNGIPVVYVNGEWVAASPDNSEGGSTQWVPAVAGDEVIVYAHSTPTYTHTSYTSTATMDTFVQSVTNFFSSLFHK